MITTVKCVIHWYHTLLATITTIHFYNFLIPNCTLISMKNDSCFLLYPALFHVLFLWLGLCWVPHVCGVCRVHFLVHSSRYLQGSSTLSHVSEFPSLWKLDDTPLHINTASHLSIHLLRDLSWQQIWGQKINPGSATVMAAWASQPSPISLFFKLIFPFSWDFRWED